MLTPVGSRWRRHSIGPSDSGRSLTSGLGRDLPAARGVLWHCLSDQIQTSTHKSLWGVFDDQKHERLMSCGHQESAFKYPLLGRRDYTFRVFEILYRTLMRSAHPRILGSGFREPNPLTWFRPFRASIPFGGKGSGLDRVFVMTNTRMRHSVWTRRAGEGGTVKSTVPVLLSAMRDAQGPRVGIDPLPIL